MEAKIAARIMLLLQDGATDDEILAQYQIKSSELSQIKELWSVRGKMIYDRGLKWIKQQRYSGVALMLSIDAYMQGWLSDYDKFFQGGRIDRVIAISRFLAQE